MRTERMDGGAGAGPAARMRRRGPALVALFVLIGVLQLSATPAAAFPSPDPPGAWPFAAAGGEYGWPVVGPVIRGFIPPSDPYSVGHRGIDIGAPYGTTLRAAQDGTVAFAGTVAGALYISIDHADGVRTTYSWLASIGVSAGETVTKGETIGATGHGHPEVLQTHLHFGARVGSTYIDPMTLLEPGDVAGLIHLAPLAGEGPGTAGSSLATSATGGSSGWTAPTGGLSGSPTMTALCVTAPIARLLVGHARICPTSVGRSPPSHW